MRVLVLLLVLAGCSPTIAWRTFGPTGTPPRGYAIDCSGPMTDMTDCLYKAGIICGISGYRIVERVDKPMILSAFGFSLSPFTDRKAVVECR